MIFLLVNSNYLIKVINTMKTIAEVKQQLINNQPLLSDILSLNLEGCIIHLQSNSKELLDKLNRYFENCNVIDKHIQNKYAADINIIAIESLPPELEITYVDWAREPGKSGRKDEYFNIKDGRVVRKVRTGMVFLQSESERIAAGPCIQYDNQLINFINSQYMNWLQNQGWLICHASGMTMGTEQKNNIGFAIAGLSGGGKSTLMLELMNNASVSYLTNDRLFVKKQGAKKQTTTQMLGIPKLPRINPGTIVGNPKLHGLLDKNKLDFYQSMDISELWEVEEKSDVPITEIYGQHRLSYSAQLSSFIILNWQRESNQETHLNRVYMDERSDILAAIMKSPGPFYQYQDGHFQKDNDEFDQNAYLQNLSNVAIYEATGNINFKKMAQLILTNLT
jgi:HprK-related kinase B